MHSIRYCISVTTVAVPLLITSVSGTAQEISAETSANCALISSNEQRLDCYDALHAPRVAQEEADEEIDDSASEETSESTDKLIGESQSAERAIFSFTDGFVTHRPNYILPLTWVNDPNPRPASPQHAATDYDYDLENEEAKYQISFKVPLLTGLFDDRTTLWFGYTQNSFWQVYNQDESAPFRETTYEPEVFLRHQLDWKIGPGKLNGVTLGFNHQSNGQSDPRSRSWNRITASATYSYDRWLFMVRPWYRLPETSGNDDNANIEKYLGHASYHAVYKVSEDQTLSLKLLNNLRSNDNHTSVELGYSFPLGDTVKGFIQYYNGYGESLIDYNHRIERVGIGIMLNDWL
ncbi:MAG: phospholipase A [Pseudomonadota bacterium]